MSLFYLTFSLQAQCFHDRLSKQTIVAKVRLATRNMTERARKVLFLINSPGGALVEKLSKAQNIDSGHRLPLNNSWIETGACNPIAKWKFVRPREIFFFSRKI